MTSQLLLHIVADLLDKTRSGQLEWSSTEDRKIYTKIEDKQSGTVYIYDIVMEKIEVGLVSIVYIFHVKKNAKEYLFYQTPPLQNEEVDKLVRQLYEAAFYQAENQEEKEVEFLNVLKKQ